MAFAALVPALPRYLSKEIRKEVNCFAIGESDNDTKGPRFITLIEFFLRSLGQQEHLGFIYFGDTLLKKADSLCRLCNRQVHWWNKNKWTRELEGLRRRIMQTVQKLLILILPAWIPKSTYFKDKRNSESRALSSDQVLPVLQVGIDQWNKKIITECLLFEGCFGPDTQDAFFQQSQNKEKEKGEDGLRFVIEPILIIHYQDLTRISLQILRDKISSYGSKSDPFQHLAPSLTVTYIGEWWNIWRQNPEISHLMPTIDKIAKEWLQSLVSRDIPPLLNQIIRSMMSASYTEEEGSQSDVSGLKRETPGSQTRSIVSLQRIKEQGPSRDPSPEKEEDPSPVEEPKRCIVS